MIRHFEELFEAAEAARKKRLVAAVAQDAEVLQAIVAAHHMGLIDATLIGDKKAIFDIADALQMDVSHFEIIKEADPLKAVRLSVDMCAAGQADFLMKGMIQTADLLRTILDKESGLRTGRTISHVGVLEVSRYPKLLALTDGGLNIAPDLRQKADIAQNAVDVMRALGVGMPRVAALAALELVNPAMPCTIDAACLSKMAERHQIRNCVIDGPLALDNAVSLEAAKHKGIDSPVAGETDVLLCPDIETANMIYKSLVFLGDARPCGIMMGAKVPLVVTSRADDYHAKLRSIALAAIVSSVKL